MNTTSQFLLGESGKELLNAVKDISFIDLVLLINAKLCRVEVETYEEFLIFMDYILDINKVVSRLFTKELPKCYKQEELEAFKQGAKEENFNQIINSIKKIQTKRYEFMNIEFDLLTIEALLNN